MQNVPYAVAGYVAPGCVPGQRGFVMIAVMLALVLVAAITLMLTTESAVEAERGGRSMEALQADYLAQAALQHALWRNANNACAGDFSIPTTPLGKHQYNATISGPGSTTAYSLSVDQDAWIRSDNPTANQSGDDQHIRLESGNLEYALLRFDLSSLPAGSRINSATAWLYLEGGKEHPEGPISIFPVNRDWTETGATWETMNDGFENSVVASIAAQPAGDVWVAVNLTAQVQAWVNGAPNHGILMAAAAEGIHAEYVSRSGAGNQQPRLEVVVGTAVASPVNIQASGTLASGVTRTRGQPIARARQSPSTIVLQLGADPGNDTIVDSFYPRNYGGANYLRVSGDPSWILRTLLRFDLGGIPAGASVLSAKLELRKWSLNGPGTATVHRVTRDWVEGTRNGGGIADGATWATHDGTNNWTSAGGDYNAAVVAKTAINAADTWVSWDIAPLVEQWLAGEPNYGLLLAGDGSLRNAQFASQGENNPAARPKLTITYACECGSTCLAPRGSGNVLFVVANPASLLAVEAYKQSLMESWGYTVNLLDDDATQATYDSAVAANDVVYISASVGSGAVGTKLTNAPIGVVNEEGALDNALGFSSMQVLPVPVGDSLDVTDNSHYITRMFPAGPLQIYAAAMGGHAAAGTLAPGLQGLANWGSSPGLAVIDNGAALNGGGGNAAGRRVLVPFGQDNTHDWSKVNNNGRLIMQRALAWGAGASDSTGASGQILLVVADPNNLTAQEAAKQTLMESWNFTVNLIDESASQAEFDAAVALADVAYVAEEINSITLGTKLREASIGVVIEEEKITDEFGISSGDTTFTEASIEITDNTHYITEPFSLGVVTFSSFAQQVGGRAGTLAPDLAVLALQPSSSTSMLDAIEKGGVLFDTATAAGRRVKLPWGGNGFDINALTADGRTIMRRAIEWAAEAVNVIDIPVMSANDDAEERTSNGFMYLDSSDLELAIASEPTDMVGIRFANVAVPQGAVISRAYVQFKVDESTSGATSLVIRGEAADDAAAFSLNVANISSRPLTAASVNWAPAAWSTVGERGPAQRTPDLAAVIQEVVGRPGWVSGNALAVIITGSGTRIAESYEGDPAGAAALHIEYAGSEEPGGGGSTDPVLDYLDEFNIRNCNSADYAGSDGSLDWSPWSWTESGEANGSCTGLIQIADDPAVPDPGSFRLMIDERNRRVDRLMDLSGFTSAILSFDYRLYNYPTTADSFVVMASADGKNWQKLAVFTGIVSQTDYQTAVYDITPFIGSSTGIGFMTEGINTIQTAYIDNVRVTSGSSGGGSCSGTFRDEFNATTFSGSDGTLAWAGDWLEVGENDGATSGDTRIMNDQSDYQLQTRDNDNGGEGVEREADLSGAGSATLTYNYRRQSLDSTSDYTSVEISANGASGPWTELTRHDGTGNDSNYVFASHNITSFASANTRIRFKTSSTMGGSDIVWFDNIQIACRPKTNVIEPSF